MNVGSSIKFFDIIPDFDLDVMKPNQNLYNLTSQIIKSLQTVLESYRPEYVFVHGDTTTTMAASIASFIPTQRFVMLKRGLEQMINYPIS